MERIRQDIVERRAHTDASLGAERANADRVSILPRERPQRVLDDLLERDRILADERLLKFRDRADTTLARGRSESPARSGSVEIERRVADEDKKAERENADAFVERERQRADAAVESQRCEHEADLIGQEARRHDTDEQLSTERSGADVNVTVLDRTKKALASCRSEQAHRSDVLAMVTHDLRSPLCVIAMSAEIIGEETHETSTREAAEEVTRAAARMERLLTDLLDVARIESGTLRIVKREHDVCTLVREVLQSYRPLFADREMTFDVELPVSPIVASFDHDRVVQVLSNLLGNALKFTPAHGTIRLHVERRADHVEFVLRDNGPGIHPDVLPHVFERFWQIDSDTRRGLGLGLYICEKIVEAHGGRIWVESYFGKGATFRFTLPMGDRVINTPAMRADAVTSKTILIIDDDESSRGALQRLLQADGYRVVIGTNGVEAMTYLGNNPAPALILLDLVMPDGSGWSFRRAQLANSKLANIPVVVMSGLDAAPGMHGTVAFLQKPIERKLLLSVVRDAVGDKVESDRS